MASEPRNDGILWASRPGLAPGCSDGTAWRSVMPRRLFHLFHCPATS